MSIAIVASKFYTEYIHVNIALYSLPAKVAILKQVTSAHASGDTSSRLLVDSRL